MEIFKECSTCKEPSKYVVGFCDGENGENGCLYNCDSVVCVIKQRLDKQAVQREKEHSCVVEENLRHSIVAKSILDARRAKRVPIYKLSGATGISSADISAYEHERKVIPVSHYESIMKALQSVEVCDG